MCGELHWLINAKCLMICLKRMRRFHICAASILFGAIEESIPVICNEIINVIWQDEFLIVCTPVNISIGLHHFI